MDVTLARCIKAAVDCPGHPLVKVAGAYAGGGRNRGKGRGWQRFYENPGKMAGKSLYFLGLMRFYRSLW